MAPKVKDPRYAQAKALFETGFYKQFRDMFTTIPKSVVARDMGMNNIRFSSLINNVDNFVIKDLVRLADLMEVDHQAFLKWVFEQYRLDKKMDKKHKK